MVCAKWLIFNQRSEAGFVWLANIKIAFSVFRARQIWPDIQKKLRVSF